MSPLWGPVSALLLILIACAVGTWIRNRPRVDSPRRESTPQSTAGKARVVRAEFGTSARLRW
jgi:hypothetical protein